MIALLTLLASTPATSSAVVPVQIQRIKVSATELLRTAEALQKRGTPQRAEPILVLLSQDPDMEVRSEARYRLAILMESSGRLRGAAILLRQILDERSDVPAVRLRLATLLQKLGDEDSALRQLRALRSAELPPAVARFVDRLSASLQASKPLGFQVEFALAPDSNINRGTRSGTLGTIVGDFTIDEGAKAKSGIGAAIRALALGRVPLSDKLDLRARVGGEANLFRRKSFNDLTLDLAVGSEMRLGRMRLAAELGVGRQWYGMSPYQRGVRLGGSVVAPLNAVSQTRIDVVGRVTDNRLNDLQDGRGLGAKLSYERALSPRLLVSAQVGADRFSARDAAYSTRSWSSGLTAYREMGRMTLIVGVEIGGVKADDRLALLVEPRKDRSTRFTVGAVFRQLSWAGFAPVTRLVIERNRSTIEFHDYSRTRTEFGISRAF
jgi:hypothetical protein